MFIWNKQEGKFSFLGIQVRFASAWEKWGGLIWQIEYIIIHCFKGIDMLEQTTSSGATQIIFFLNCLSSEYDMRKTSSYLSVNKLDYKFMGSEKIFSEVLAPCTLIKSDDEKDN